MYTHVHHPKYSTAFEDAVEEQKEINPEPYDAFITSSLFRFKFAIKWRVLRYVFRFDLHGEKCLPSKENVKPWFSGCYLIPTWRHWFTKRERQWLLIKTKWARRLLVFFTDQTRGEIDHAEQWTSVVNDAEGGNNGGEIVATGTPEDVAKVKNSYTGHFLKVRLKAPVAANEKAKKRAS